MKRQKRGVIVGGDIIQLWVVGSFNHARQFEGATFQDFRIVEGEI